MAAAERTASTIAIRRFTAEKLMAQRSSSALRARARRPQISRKTFLIVAVRFLIVAVRFLVVAVRFLVVAVRFLVVAVRFLVVAVRFHIVPKRGLRAAEGRPRGAERAPLPTASDPRSTQDRSRGADSARLPTASDPR